MKQIILKTNYEQDFALWVEDTVTQLKAENFSQVDWGNLIEEIEGLTKKDRRELENCLVTLFEHGLKRRYVSLPDCYRGWETTLRRTQQQLNRILRDSPSLKTYLASVSEECYRDALLNMRQEYDVNFPDFSPFPQDVETLLNTPLW